MPPATNEIVLAVANVRASDTADRPVGSQTLADVSQWEPTSPLFDSASTPVIVPAASPATPSPPTTYPARVSGGVGASVALADAVGGGEIVALALAVGAAVALAEAVGGAGSWPGPGATTTSFCSPSSSGTESMSSPCPSACTTITCPTGSSGSGTPSEAGGSTVPSRTTTLDAGAPGARRTVR